MRSIHHGGIQRYCDVSLAYSRASQQCGTYVRSCMNTQVAVCVRFDSGRDSPPAPAPAGRKMADELTLQQFPCTSEGHLKLLSRANYYRRSMKHAWGKFFEEVRASLERGQLKAEQASQQARVAESMAACEERQKQRF